jgi:hypothetical protein
MKRLLAVLLILGTLSAVFANPMEPLAFGKLWFDAQNQAQMQFAPNLSWYGATTIYVNDGFNDYIIPVDFSAPEPIFLSLPSEHLSPQSGYVRITIPGSLVDAARWGSSINNNFSPLIGTECAVRTMIGGLEGSYAWFAKDYSPTSGEVFNPSARSTIDVACYDANGLPVENVPIHNWGYFTPLGATDSSGHAILSVFSGKTNIKVRNPLDQSIACDTTFFAEPGQSYFFTANFNAANSDDPVMQVPAGTFSIYPNVLHGSQNIPLHLEYDAKLLASANVELYDLKGRLIGSQNYSGNSMIWHLPKLSSGVYFLRLNSGSRNLGIQTLIV